MTRDSLYLRWRGRDVRIRHDDPRFTRCSPVIATLQSAMAITTEVATLRLVMARERAYDVQTGRSAAGVTPSRS